MNYLNWLLYSRLSASKTRWNSNCLKEKLLHAIRQWTWRKSCSIVSLSHLMNLSLIQNVKLTFLNRAKYDYFLSLILHEQYRTQSTLKITKNIYI